MRKSSKKRKAAVIGRKVTLLVAIFATCFGVLAAKSCYAKEMAGPKLPSDKTTAAAKVTATPTSAPTVAPTDTPVPTEAPEQEAESQGEGMLSAPSDASDEGENVFQGNNGDTVQTDEKLQNLLATLQNSFPAGNGSWAVYVGDLVKDTEGSINANRMQSASLIKLYIMGAIYDNYDNMISQYGQGTIDSYLYSMITVSDNDAANSLVSCLGGGDSSLGMSAVNSYCAANGYTQTSMGRLLLQSNANGDNYTSVADCGHFLKNVYKKRATGEGHADAMFNLLAAQTIRHKIPSQMPAGVSVANKTGELSDVENDAGIIYNSSNDLVIVFMSENDTEVGSAQSTIGSLSRMIYDYYQ